MCVSSHKSVKAVRWVEWGLTFILSGGRQISHSALRPPFEPIALGVGSIVERISGKGTF